MSEEEILAALKQNDEKTVRALREKDDAQILEREVEAQRLRQLLHEVRNASSN